MKFKQTLIAAMVALAPMGAMAAGSVDVFYVNQDVDIEGAGKDDGDGFGIRAQADLGQGISLSASHQSADLDDNSANLKETRIGLSYGTALSGINVGAGIEYVDFGIDVGGGAPDLSLDGYSLNVQASIAVVDNLNVYGKAAYTDVNDGDGMEYTVGALYSVNKQLGVFAEYRLADLELDLGGGSADVDIDTLRVGVRYNF